MRLFGTKPPKNQGITAPDRSSEQGAIIIWILIMVSLFAALNYMISKNTRSGASNLSAQQAELAASEILDYASAIKRAVQKLQINGCGDTEVSFENIGGGYVNPNSPTDKSCHVFEIAGGGIRHQVPDDSYLDKDKIAVKAINFTQAIIQDIGTSEIDGYLIMRPLAENICTAINDSTNNNIDISNARVNITAAPLQGNYTNSTVLGDDATEAEIAGQMSGCVVDIGCGAAGECFVYYQMLIAR